MSVTFPELAYGTPRKLPSARSLKGRVVVLDIAFSANSQGASFERVTLPFINGLGDRLAMWIDHHDHEKQAEYNLDPRFILRTKAQHGACPEMVTPERVRLAGPIDTICCHTDFDGLCSAAKWIRGGEEPYPGADADAHAVDTRLGTPSAMGIVMDQAIRARANDVGLRGLMIRFLVDGAKDRGLFQTINEAADLVRVNEDESRRLAEHYEVVGRLAVVDGRLAKRHYDKTVLLLLGQERAAISLVHDQTTVTIAARFDSGIDLVSLLGLNGGMPTRVSVGTDRLSEVIEKLKK